MALSHKGSLEEASKVDRCVMRSEQMQEEVAKEMMTDHSSPTAMPRETTVREETTEIIATMAKVVQVKREKEPTETEKEMMKAIREEDDRTGKTEVRGTAIVAKKREFLEWMITRTLITQKRMPLLTSKIREVPKREDV